jgi:hypothetical protein
MKNSKARLVASSWENSDQDRNSSAGMERTRFKMVWPGTEIWGLFVCMVCTLFVETVCILLLKLFILTTFYFLGKEIINGQDSD